jgi:soluble P-type ATPase
LKGGCGTHCYEKIRKLIMVGDGINDVHAVVVAMIRIMHGMQVL